jgi:hypothetical protein
MARFELERLASAFGARFGRPIVVLSFHAFGGFGFFSFTAELVCSAAKPPTAFSTIRGTFPRLGVRSQMGRGSTRDTDCPEELKCRDSIIWSIRPAFRQPEVKEGPIDETPTRVHSPFFVDFKCKPRIA